MTRWRNPALASVLTTVLGTAALAQASTNYTSVETISGKPTQLTYHASANHNCTPAPLPTVRVTEPPKSGLLIVRGAVLTTDKISGCPQLKVPAQVVFYQSRANYTGPDHVAYVVTAVNGEVAAYDVTITVKPAPAPSAPGSNPASRI